MLKLTSLISFYTFCFISSIQLSAGETVWNYTDVIQEYVVGRPDFPAQTFEPLKQFVNQNPTVLDVDFRTGISTRQLFRMGFKQVTGCYREPALIEKARELSPKEIQYVEADITQSLPFKNGEFELITSFNDLAFLSEENSIQEISRVIKPNGHFLAVHRGTKKGGSKVSQQILIDEFGELPPSDTATDESTLFTTEEILAKAGFTLIDKSTFFAREYRTKEQVLNHVLSTTPWISAKKMATQEQYERLITKLSAYLDEQLAKSEKPGMLLRENFYTTWLFQKQDPSR